MVETLISGTPGAQVLLNLAAAPQSCQAVRDAGIAMVLQSLIHSVAAALASRSGAPIPPLARPEPPEHKNRSVSNAWANRKLGLFTGRKSIKGALSVS